jgi:hypothetical protein
MANLLSVRLTRDADPTTSLRALYVRYAFGDSAIGKSMAVVGPLCSPAQSLEEKSEPVKVNLPLLSGSR